jgi:hypothetical protein
MLIAPSSSSTKWVKGNYWVGAGGRPRHVSGWTYNGCGLTSRGAAVWGLHHLNTGHNIACIKLARFGAFQVATEIAECGDWSFLGIMGPINSDPDLFKRVKSLMDGYAPDVLYGEANPYTIACDERMARQVAEMIEC